MASVLVLLASLASAAAAPGAFLGKQPSGSAEEPMLNSDLGSGRALSSYDAGCLGPLAGLLGTWEGKRGINVVRVPQVTHDEEERTASFTSITQDYMETITFAPILGAVLNRGYQDANQYDPSEGLNQTLLGVTYYLQVHQLDCSGTKGSLLHVENGQWLLQAQDGIDASWSVGRMALIPHGAAVVALGGSTNLSSGEAVQETQTALSWSFGFPQNVGVPPTLGYGELGPGEDPIARLTEDVGNVSRAVELHVSTRGNGGSIGMLPNVKSQAFNEAYNSTLWIEEMHDGSQQLQYVQTVFLDFEAKFVPDCESSSAATSDSSSGRDCLIKWSHYQANTLRRVESFQSEEQEEYKGKFPFIR